VSCERREKGVSHLGGGGGLKFFLRVGERRISSLGPNSKSFSCSGVERGKGGERAACGFFFIWGEKGSAVGLENGKRKELLLLNLTDAFPLAGEGGREKKEKHRDPQRERKGGGGRLSCGRPKKKELLHHRFRLPRDLSFERGKNMDATGVFRGKRKRSLPIRRIKGEEKISPAELGTGSKL